MSNKKKTNVTEEVTTVPVVNPATEENTNTTVGPTTEEVIEVEWGEIEHIHDFKNKVADLENYFSNMCLTYEKSKANIMTQIVYGQNDLYNMAQSLQKSKNIDESLTYELKLPAAPGEKGYFLRKDD
jgi:hypothetical protein